MTLGKNNRFPTRETGENDTVEQYCNDTLYTMRGIRSTDCIPQLRKSEAQRKVSAKSECAFFSCMHKQLQQDTRSTPIMLNSIYM
jgi:hypothetical protein